MNDNMQNADEERDGTNGDAKIASQTETHHTGYNDNDSEIQIRPQKEVGDENDRLESVLQKEKFKTYGIDSSCERQNLTVQR
jgi:hypothetical protein